LEVPSARVIRVCVSERERERWEREMERESARASVRENPHTVFLYLNIEGCLATPSQLAF
jgi:hypothetical protein